MTRTNHTPDVLHAHIPGMASERKPLPASQHGFLEAVRAGRYSVVPKPIAAILDAADALDRFYARPPVGVDALCTTVVEDIVAGKPFPDDLAATVQAAELAGERDQVAQLAANRIQSGLRNRLPGVLVDHADQILGGLRSQLENNLTNLREASAALGDLAIDSPAAIVDATPKERAAFKAFVTGVEEYEQIRDSQRRFLTLLNRTTRKTAGLPVADATWAALRESGLVEVSDVRLQGGVGAGEPLQRTRRLIKRKDVWLPDLKQLTDAWDELTGMQG